MSVGSLLYFNRSSQYEAYFIYFLGSYSLGMLAFLAKNYSDPKIRGLAKFILFALGVVIAISSFQELWARNVLAWCVALALLIWGNASYPPVNPNKYDLKQRALQAIAWASPRSYCVFLIHFAFILLLDSLCVYFAGKYDLYCFRFVYACQRRDGSWHDGSRSDCECDCV
ncbi:MAG: hypothetical protein B7Y55_14110 [Polynucleobacter sp. 35-46-207]|nr:MAG: hypothetical protein B7Y55_14110 [Polynucleobacter sp. 35-46-207]